MGIKIKKRNQRNKTNRGNKSKNKTRYTIFNRKK